MLIQKQRFRHKPDEGIYGDCHRTCIASLLDLPAEEVPHFNRNNPSATEFWEEHDAFMLTKGLVEVSHYFDCSLEDVLRVQAGLNPGVYYLLGGESKNGVNHTVICLDDEIVMDPAQDNSGIVGPLDNGFYSVSHYVPSSMTTR